MIPGTLAWNDSGNNKAYAAGDIGLTPLSYKSPMVFPTGTAEVDANPIRVMVAKQKFQASSFFVIEGVLPFLVPTLWRDTFRRLTEMTDGQIRFIGLTSMLAGLLLLFIARP